jgi:hypothetical protein
MIAERAAEADARAAGFGDVELAGELDWEPGAVTVYLRRLDEGRAWRVDDIFGRPLAPPSTSRRGNRRP